METHGLLLEVIGTGIRRCARLSMFAYLFAFHNTDLSSYIYWLGSVL